MASANPGWEKEIDASKSSVFINWREIFAYRDLLVLFVRRDFVTLYKQTIFGPLWYIIQPILTALMFALIFGRMAGIPTDGIPKLVFYLSGFTFWTYFAESLTKVSDSFILNQNIFSKVYFPRIIIPLSIVSSNLLKLLIQFAMFCLLYFYHFFSGAPFEPNVFLLLLPVFIATEALLALSLGMMITALTTKYRDLKFLIQFAVQLAMFASPVVYPLSLAKGNLKWLLLANPMTGVIEGVKFSLFGVGDFRIEYLAYSMTFAILLFFISSRIFHRVERNFVDTI